MTKEEAKPKIIELIKRFHALDPHKVKASNEAATKQGFIQPLFEALGWDFTNPKIQKQMSLNWNNRLTSLSTSFTV